MKKLIPIFVFLFASLGMYGQNWNPLNPGVTNYFVNNYGYVRAMRIDSLVAYGNQLHYYPYKRAHFNSWGEFSWSGPADTLGSWLGADVIKKTDGTFLFPNRWNDTIKIKTLASVGESWTFYQGVDSVYYIAEVTSIDTMTVLGILDSVRRISLSAFANGNMVITDSFDHSEILLSKGHGFCSVMDLYLFPFHEPGSGLPFDDYYTTNSLRTHADWHLLPDTPGKYGAIFNIFDYIDPTPAQLSDWDVGDVYEYVACFPDVFPSAQCYLPYTSRFDSIIGKTVYNNGIEYIRKGWIARSIYDGFTTTILSYSIVPYQDTVFMPDTGRGFRESGLPEELKTIWDNPKWIYYYVPDDTSVCVISPAYHKLQYFYGLSSVETKHKVKLGIGEINWERSEYFDGNTMDNHGRLIYSVRNGVSCGSYYFPDTTTPVVTHITNINETSPITIYPNPAPEQLTIETSLSHYKLSLVNTVGQVVYSKDGCDSKQIVDVRAFAAGVYQLRIETAGHEVINRKLIIQK